MPYNNANLRHEAHTRFGVEHFRPGQEEILRNVMEGRDTLGLLPTGAGKSLCYQLPSLLLPHKTVIVSPLISLMQDQQEKLAEVHIEAAKLNSTLSRSQERQTVHEIETGETKIVYVTPERLENPEYLQLLRNQGVSLFVVDEAHCISQWGHDFRPAYLALRDAAEQLGRPPILALTATATPDVTGDIIQQLKMRSPAVINTGIERPNLFWEVFRTVSGIEKRKRLIEMLKSEKGCGIIYVATIKLVEELWQWLTESGYKVAKYHGKLPAHEREQTQQQFMDGQFHAIIATNAFGLGIDKQDIRFVVHYTFPDSLETYYQEAGRAGRDGEPARATLLYRLEDRRIQAFFLGGKYPKREDSLNVFKLLSRSDGAKPTPLTLKALVAATHLGDRKIRVIVAQLEGAGIVKRTNQGIVKVQDFPDAVSFDAFLSEYETRHHTDRERLRAMMRYAESTQCRTRQFKMYFGEAVGEDCQYCDNCRERAAGKFDVIPSASRRPTPMPPAMVQNSKLD
jgi:ATP-dependent DNA helicase RecQ